MHILLSRIVWGGALAAPLVAVAFAACTDSYRLGASGGGAASGSSGSGAGGGVTLHDSGTCNLTCSNDLKNVVDCKGVVQTACTVDQGCANAVCVGDPCMAAEVSKSSYGCDYWAVKTAQRPQADGACFAAFVTNTWGKPVHLQVSYGTSPLKPEDFAVIPVVKGQAVTYTAYDPVGGLPVGEVAILFLSRNSAGGSVVACPDGKAGVDAETGVAGTGIGTAFHVQTDYPVVAYQMDPYGGGQAGVTSATLLLPTSAWDTNYVAINAYGAADQAIYPGGFPSLDIVASQDTQVTILPKAAIVAGPGVVGAAAGAPVVYSLQAGQVLQITQPEELTGSPIQSTLPVGVFGASTGMQVPLGQRDVDSAQQQIPPVKALGSEYVAVRYRSRGTVPDEAVPWRLVGAVDGTTLTWSPAPPPGAPTGIGLGEIREITAPGPFVVRSQDGAHPFYLGGYMTGGGKTADGGAGLGGEGDPEWVNVITPSQYLDHYVLFTDPTYSETDLVVVRTPSKVDGTYAGVTLVCAGNATPQTLTGWQKIGAYEYTRVDLVTGAFMGVGGCSNGRHEMKSALPFGVTVWGWGTTAQQTQLVSYAYPAGAGFQPINMVVVPTTK